jgi:hypothetical protein
MQLSHSHRFVFVHIFKTGGTSMRSVFEPLTERPGYRLWRKFRTRLGSPPPARYPRLSAHARAIEIRDAVPSDVFANYFKFAFVRNPWDWQVSWYHYVLQNREHHEHEAVTRLNGFEEFLSWRMDHPVWHQRDFVVDERGECMVDFVGRFESIQADFEHVCAAAGIEAQLPHLNKSQHKDYRDYFSDRAIHLVEAYSKTDIEFFGYRFDPMAEEELILPLRDFAGDKAARRQLAA